MSILDFNEFKETYISDGNLRKDIRGKFRYNYIFATDGFIDAANSSFEFFARNKDYSDYAYKIFQLDEFVISILFNNLRFEELWNQSGIHDKNLNEINRLSNLIGLMLNHNNIATKTVINASYSKKDNLNQLFTYAYYESVDATNKLLSIDDRSKFNPYFKLSSLEKKVIRNMLRDEKTDFDDELYISLEANLRRDRKFIDSNINKKAIIESVGFINDIWKQAKPFLE